ncbi:MAG: twin-arginine translocation signal domain-containing protein [Candidatus Moduliflexus flocculans]|nr:twin-arginine translocation signal domain-containing protein [Candidatus Moduliflexus flocculans]
MERKPLTNRREFILGGAAAAAAAGLAGLGAKSARGPEPLPAIGTWPWPEGASIPSRRPRPRRRA